MLSISALSAKTGAARPAPTAPRVPVSAANARRIVQAWLIALAGLVLLMVTVGGATRLTGSGLSITEWKPILGAIPPLNAADWQDAFEKYKQITQYKLINSGMSLDAFKVIYWWEWGHRQLGRFLGLAFLVPFLVFVSLKWLPRGLSPKLLAVFALGGLQGGMGWFMVQSGLSARTDVSQYRLAAHLTLAAIIFAALTWLALSLRANDASRTRLRTLPVGAAGLSLVLVGLLLLQIVLGAFVAGLKAGLTHNTWPLMDGRIIPAGLFTMSPWWLNPFENVMTVQFNHRMLAYIISGLALWHAWRVARVADDERVTRSALLFAGGIITQIGLGVWTLLLAVPLWLGLVHQAAAFILLGLAIWHRHAIIADRQ